MKKVAASKLKKEIARLIAFKGLVDYEWEKFNHTRKGARNGINSDKKSRTRDRHQS